MWQLLSLRGEVGSEASEAEKKNECRAGRKAGRGKKNVEDAYTQPMDGPGPRDEK